MLRETVGVAPDSAAPNRKRAVSREARFQAVAVAAVKADHSSTITVRTRRGPKRSPSHPEGTWKRAYPHTKALKIQPIAKGPIPRSFRIAGAKTLSAARSKQRVKPRQKNIPTIARS